MKLPNKETLKDLVYFIPLVLIVIVIAIRIYMGLKYPYLYGY